MALEILQNKSAIKQSETDALNLAISVLEDKFAPELQVLENANANVVSLQTAIQSKEAEIIDLKANKSILEKTIIEINKEPIL